MLSMLIKYVREYNCGNLFKHVFQGKCTFPKVKLQVREIKKFQPINTWEIHCQMN